MATPVPLAVFAYLVSEHVHAEGVGVLAKAGAEVVVLDLLQVRLPDSATDRIIRWSVSLACGDNNSQFHAKKLLPERLPCFALYACQSSSQSVVTSRAPFATAAAVPSRAN